MAGYFLQYIILNVRAAGAQLEVKLTMTYPKIECLKRSFQRSMVTSEYTDAQAVVFTLMRYCPSTI